MKKMLSLLALTALCLLLALPAMAAQEGYYTYEYSEEWGGAMVTGYSGNETNVVIPSTLGGYDVVYFNIWSPGNFNSNTTVRLPDTIRYIGALPAELEALYLPNSIEAINAGANSMGNYKTYLDKDSAIAKQLINEPGEYPSLKFIDPDEPSMQIYYVRNEAGDTEVGLAGYWGTEEIVTIPEGIHHIYQSAFSPEAYYIHNTTAKKIFLPESLKTIGDYAFDCENLEELWLPPNLVECGSIIYSTDIVVYCDLDSQTAQLLSPSDCLQGITDPDEPDWGFHGDGKGNLVAVRYNGNDQHIVVPDGVVRIGDYAISNKDALTLTVPDSVTSIGNCVVNNGTYMTDIYLPNNITQWGTSEPFYCSANTVIHCSLDSETFRTMPYIEYGIGGILDPKEPDWLWEKSSSGTAVLSKYLGSASKVIIPDGVTGIADQMFYENDTIVTLVIPDSVTKLGDKCFYNMSALKDVYLSENITDWGNNNFHVTDTENTEELLIHLSIDSISFRNMPSHQNLNTRFSGVYDANHPDYLWASDGSGGTVVYKYTGSASKVVIPDGTTGIADEAFHDMPQLASVTVPDSVTSIGHYAFAFNYDNYDANPGSYQILTIYLPDNITEVGYGNFMPENKRLAVCTYGSKTADAIDHVNELNGHAWDFYSDPRWPGCLIGKLNGTVYFGGYIGSSSVINVPPVCTAISGEVSHNSPITVPNLSVIIPEGVTRIEEGGFGTLPITSIKLPSTIKTLGKRSLENLFLETLVIPEGVTKLSADLAVSHIENLYLPASLTSIHDDAFPPNKLLSNGSHDYYVDTVYCYKGTKAAAWAQSRENQKIVYLDKGEYNIFFPSEFYADAGSQYDWQSLIQIFPEPDIDYTLKISSGDTSVISVKDNELNLKKPGTAKLTVKSTQLGVSKSKTMTVYAPVESFSVPEYIFHQKRTSSNSKTVTIKVSNVTPSEGTNPLYYWNGFSADHGGIHTRAEKLTLPRPSIPCAYSLVVASASDVYRQCSLIFYDDVESVKFSAFSGDYYAGDVITPTISVKIDGTTYENNRYTYTLTSSDPTVAKVTSKGKLQLLSKGTATITCEALDGTTVKRKITVQDINVYTIPKALQVISSEAFAGCPAQKIVIQDGCQAIGNKAFADCPMLETVEIPASVTGIAPDAFDGCPDGFVIVAPEGSYAAQYAEENGYTE